MNSDLNGRKLVYADDICRYIKTKINPYGKPFKGSAYEFGLKIMEYIENMSVAYDVDKVVERLESTRDTAVKNIELNSQSYDIKEEIESARKHYEWIIQVVKSGGKE